MGKGKKRKGTQAIAQAAGIDWACDVSSGEAIVEGIQWDLPYWKHGHSGSRQDAHQSEVSGSGPIPERQSRVIQTPEALKNQDILSLIFEHFDLQLGSPSTAQAQTRKDLLSAAKTCKAFVEPALDSLWRVLPSLLPLLLLLPSAEVNNGHYFVDELPLDDSGWRRLDVHARRVRTLYMVPLHIVISPNIYLRIRAMRHSPLLPGLKKIYIPNTFPLDLSSALFLASGSTFNTVQIDDNAISDRQFFVPFLSSLYIKSPGLSHLALRGVVPSASLEPICRFTELQSFEIRLCNPHLHPQLLRKLGQLPHLLDLIINVAAPIQPHADPISISNSKFRQLRHLKILGTATSISRILNELKGLTNLSALKIEEVLLDGWDLSIESTWRSSFEVISTFSAVEDIEITHDRNQPRLGGLYTLWASSLAPLFRLDNLKSLVMNFNATGSDDDFRLLACNFPKLKKLVVLGPAFPNRVIGKTLACLYYLSRECPDLREIKIAISFDISNNLDAIKKLSHFIVRNYQHPLEKLYIESNFGQQLQPVQLVQVARFLDLIFPNLSTLETDNSKTTEAANWKGIHELRLALQDARINLSSSDTI